MTERTQIAVNKATTRRMNELSGGMAVHSLLKKALHEIDKAVENVGGDPDKIEYNIRIEVSAVVEAKP